MKKMINILYEDNHLLVVIKPQGIPSQADNSNDDDMLSLLKKYIKEKYNKPGNVYLGLVHRLDRPVGGVMVFAKTSKAASRLCSQIAEHRLKKTYLCICEGIVKDGSMEHYLLKDRNKNIVYSVNKSTKGAKRALLHYKVIETYNNKTLCSIDLITGRSHQIRVQFSAGGHPLINDMKYNRNAKTGKWIALYAYSLEFEHPTQKKQMKFYAVKLMNEALSVLKN